MSAKECDLMPDPLSPVSPAEGRTLRDLFEAVFEAGHWSWPTVDAPTRAARRDQAVQDALDQAVALVLRPSPEPEKVWGHCGNCGGHEFTVLEQCDRCGEAEALKHLVGDPLPPAPGTEDR
jgi:hypothetical protein